MRIGGQQQHVNIGITACGCLYLTQNRFSFGIIGGPAAGEYQLQCGHELFSQLVRLNYADRILEPVEAGDLSDYRPLRVDPVFLGCILDYIRVEFYILVAEGVDTRWYQVLRMWQFLGKGRQ